MSNPSKVHITYDVETGTGIEKRELPFVVGVMADLSFQPEAPLARLFKRRSIHVDKDNFPSVMNRLSPRILLTAPNKLSAEDASLRVELRFKRLEDFEPQNIACQVQPLHELLDLRGRLVTSGGTGATVDSRIAELDGMVSAQLDEILHAPEFQRAEAAWRGLYYLVSNTDSSPMLKIRVLNVSKKELLRDTQTAVEFDQTAIFKLVYEREYETLGGEPYNVLIGDYEFGSQTEDIELLHHLSNVAAAAHVPFVAAASPTLFGLESFTELDRFRDLSKVFDHERFVPWKAFRDSDDSRYTGLVLPRVLLRSPHGNQSGPPDEFHYEENVDGSDHDKYLWGNPAYFFAVRLTSAFSKYGWCAAIHGVERGGLVGGLPIHLFTTEDGDVAVKCPIEIAISDRRRSELARLGFIPLSHAKGTDKAVFFSAPSCHKPQIYEDDTARANSMHAAQVDSILAASRFAHYLASILREKRGSFANRADCEAYLTEWIGNYVTADDAPAEVRARCPLRSAIVEVVETSDGTARYRAVAHIQPRLQPAEI